MNLTSGIKDKRVKWCLFGLGFVVLGGVVCSVSYLNRNEAPAANATAAVKDIKRQVPCGPNCSHSDAEHNKEIVAQDISVKGSESVASAKIGEVLDVEFGDNLMVRAKVTVKKELSQGRRSVVMDLIGQQGYVYWLESDEGPVIGNIIIKKNGENQVYKFTSENDQWTLQEIPYQQFICSSGVTDESTGMPASDAPFTPAGTSAIVPLLSSRPSATAVVYMDFDGEVVSGTRWVNGGTINAEESGHTETQIRQIWADVSEDMRPFDINVTTDRAVFDAAPVNRRMQCIVTPTTDAQPGAGGVAYLNSFYDGTDGPCWCFNLGGSSTAMTISHEVGHTFGLRHDGLNAAEYHPGNGTWGPIMGAPFGNSVVSWSKGDYLGNTNTEDDLEMITAAATNGFGYRTDDYGDSNATGFDVSGNTGETAVSVIGVIETTADVDVFTFTTSGGPTLLTASPTTAFPNMNIRVRLFDDAGNLVSESDPAGVYSASVSTTLGAGVYHFHVEGIADGSPDITGFNDYGSLGEYGITGNITGLGGLIIDITEPSLDDVSIQEGNGLVLNASVVGEADSVIWSVVGSPLGGIATFYPANKIATRATFSQPGLYTLRFRAIKDGLASDATMRVSVEELGGVQLFSNRGPAITVTSPEEFYSREGLLNGRAQDDDIPVAAPPAIEWVVVSGTAVIENPLAVSPLIRFADSAPNVVALESSDGQIRTFKQITVQSVYEARSVVAGGISARWFIPRNNNLGMTWVAPGFDDSTWALSPLAVGFAPNQNYNQFLAEGTDIKSEMKNKSSSAYLRVPFTIPSLDYVQGMKLKINYNDGFALYINGVEVARKNTESGILTYSSKAVTKRSVADVLVADEIDLSSVVSSLVVGENIFAIHGVNKSKSNNDFLLNPELVLDLVASPYLAFLEANGFNLDPNGNNDGDALLNFVEHALGTDPNAVDSATPLVTLPDGSMKIVLPADMPQDVDYIIEKSIDMVTWAPIATKRGKADWTGESIIVNVIETAGGKITFSIRQVSAAPTSFYRMNYKLRGPVITP